MDRARPAHAPSSLSRWFRGAWEQQPDDADNPADDAGELDDLVGGSTYGAAEKGSTARGSSYGAVEDGALAEGGTYEGETQSDSVFSKSRNKLGNAIGRKLQVKQDGNRDGNTINSSAITTHLANRTSRNDAALVIVIVISSSHTPPAASNETQ
jgi:hypothetical protein